MKYLQHLLTCFGFVIFSGCHNKCHPEIKNTTTYTYNRYSQVPQYIKTYIDSASKEGSTPEEKFSIAEPGEPWDAGCTRGDNPFRQFISAEKTPDVFTMKFWAGGFIKSKQQMIINLNGERITRYSTTIINDDL